MSTTQQRFPTIYRCTGCGALVHPTDPQSALLAWCGRCRRFTTVEADGG